MKWQHGVQETSKVKRDKRTKKCRKFSIEYGVAENFDRGQEPVVLDLETTCLELRALATCILRCIWVLIYTTYSQWLASRPTCSTTCTRTQPLDESGLYVGLGLTQVSRLMFWFIPFWAGITFIDCIRVNLDHAALSGHMRDTAINPILGSQLGFVREPWLVVLEFVCLEMVPRHVRDGFRLP